MAPGEFRRYRLAEDGRAEIAQALDDPRVCGWKVIPVDRRAVRGRHVVGGDDVLDRDRNAGQRTRTPRGVLRQIFERPQHGLDVPGLFEAIGYVSIRGRFVGFEAAQKFENPRIRLGLRACGWIGHDRFSQWFGVAEERD